MSLILSTYMFSCTVTKCTTNVCDNMLSFGALMGCCSRKHQAAFVPKCSTAGDGN